LTLDWPPTEILPTFASQLAGITDISHCTQLNLTILHSLNRWNQARHGWLTPVILTTQEAEIRKIVHKTLSPKDASQKRSGGVAQDERPEFKP
jgi:hypothetical protein